MPTTTANSRTRDTRPATAARLRKFARMRAEKAIAELERQGYTVIPPEKAATEDH